MTKQVNVIPPKPGRSLAEKFPQVAELWDYEKNGDLTPEKVGCGSEYRAFWKCKDYPEHTWQAKVGLMAVNRKPSKCPYCEGHKLFPGFNDLEKTFPTIAAQWHPTKNGDLTPRDVMPGSRMRAWWKCDFCGYEWEATVCSRTDKRRRWHIGCPKCNGSMSTSFAEQAILFYLRRDSNYDIENRKKLECDGSSYEFDIFIENIKVAIEYDGEYWHSRRNHIDKAPIAEKAGVKLIKILAKESLSETDPDKEFDIETVSTYDYIIEENDVCLNDVILKIENRLNLHPKVKIDVKNDRLAIYAQYKHVYRENSIANVCPEIAAEWDYEKNQGLTPEMFLPGSRAEV